MSKQDIREVGDEVLKTFFEQNQVPSFRMQQIQQWLWQKSVTKFEAMTNLPKQLRLSLAETFTFHPLTVAAEQQSQDATLKFLFKLHDDEHIEGVLIPAPNRLTACISSQVGCSLTCKFCATGNLKRRRNLTAAEIYDQVALMNAKALDHYKRRITNVVYMGMGEPLLNYQATLQSLNYIGAAGLRISKSKITISTAGIAKMIKQLGDDQIKCKLALSLHSADETKRQIIMPITKTNSLSDLLAALQYYYEKVRRVITLEYILFKDFNDSLEDARALCKFSRQVPSKINLIHYNAVGGVNFCGSSVGRWRAFSNYLEDKGLNVRVRQSRGGDIDSACGQLANFMLPS